MIITTFYGTRPDGVDLYQRKSDQGVMLLQVETGRQYPDPIDIDPCPYTYEETDVPIPPEPEPPEPVPPEPGDLIVADTLDMLGQLGVDISEPEPEPEGEENNDR